MRYRCCAVALTILALSAVTAPAAYIGIEFGPLWPRDVLETAPEGRRVALGVGLKTGGFIADMIGLGFALDFQWNRATRDSTSEFLEPDPANPGQNRTISLVSEIGERRYMFPMSVFLSIDPLKDLPVRPVVTGQFGMSLLVYLNTNSDDKRSSDSGPYVGLFGKVSLDAVVAIGGPAGFYIGPSYQWGEPRRRASELLPGMPSGQFYRRDMQGFGIHIGLRVAN